MLGENQPDVSEPSASPEATAQAVPDQRAAAEPPPARPVSAPPAAPVSGAPVSAVPVSAVPVSAAPVSAVPVSALPVSAAPVSAAPAGSSAALDAEPPAANAAEPVSAPPAAPVPAPPAPSVPGPAASPVSAPPAASVSAPPAGPVSAPPAGPVSAPPDRPVSAPPAAFVSAPPAEQVSAPPAASVSAPPAASVSAPPAEQVSAPPAASVSAPPAGPVSAPPAGPGRVEQGDPEQVLAAYRWQLDPATLREIVEEPDELRTVRRRLTEKLGTAVDNRARARLLSLRAVVSRILGELDDALADARLALTYAEATGELRRIALAQARLAHVLRWRGEFTEADQLFARATSPELPDRLRAALHEHAGRSCFDQGRYMEACQHFEQALDLRGSGDPDLLARVRLALDAVAERVATAGFGPYPRSRDEVLERIQPPVPVRDGGLWGYTDPDGDLVVPARYADAQPFAEGLAWVRRPQTERWSLIALTGTTVIEPSFLAVRAFSEGLAWVVRDGAEGWLAIDPTGNVVIPPGFADVRPFRRGVAAVRREGWGAVDRTGRIVVPTRYHSFRTPLADGRHVDGFTDEGLAVVELAGRHGVVDHTGAMLVPPVHPTLVIHPVAFLVGTGAGRWGALDRRGNPLIDPVHRSAEDLLEEIERLLTDANPVL
ncbi:hypothetical protein D7193_14410 [Micromonospora costi]|uniref:Uncharacterized protein n=2 Tax=Micromonospora costi TaxID=1530042 RepID=A0A3B0A5V9_9ACTN|nr:hypothetical protein D7193_14410 [Micromonospora costi]